MFSKSTKFLLTAIFSLLTIVAGVFIYTETIENNRESSGYFYTELYQLCGAAYKGRITANSSRYPFIHNDQKIIAHFRICRRERVKVALHVLSTNGQIWDRSRTLLVTRSSNDVLELRHLNRQPDGRLTGYSMYGGYSVGSGRNGLQQFVSDTDSEIHDRWQIEVVPEQRFTYGSKKNGEWIFRVDFDLTKPLDELPPSPWGIAGGTQTSTREITLEDGTTIIISCQILDE